MDDSDRRRNILIIAGFVFMLILSGVAIYFAFFSEKEGPGGTPPTFGEESDEREGVDEDTNRRDNRESWDDTPPRLIQITGEPVSGAIAFEDEAGLTLRYAERETSHIFDVDLETFEDVRLSNETVPGVYRALFAAGGDSLILRYLDDDNRTIKTYSARLVEREEDLREGQTPYTLEGEFLPDNITELVLSPDKTKLFWMTETLRESLSVVTNIDGSESQDVFSSEFTEWIPQWFDTNAISMTTKASGLAPGYSYVLGTETGLLERINTASGNTGLTTLVSPDGSYVFYSVSTEEGLQNYLLDTETGEADFLFVSTLPDKCAWSPVETDMLYCGVPESLPKATYPDVWYQGRVLFTDEIWEVDASTGEAQEIYSPRETDREDLDIYRPFISEDGSHLIFNDKHDMSLWSFRLEEASFSPDQIPEGAPGI